MKRLAWFSAAAAAFLSAGLGFAQVGAPVSGAIAQRNPVVVCKSWVQVSTPSDTNEDTTYTCNIPANSLGPNGALRVFVLFSTTNSANNKTVRIRYSGASGTTFFSAVATTTLASAAYVVIGNRNATNSQVGALTGSFSWASLGTAVVTGAIDTTAGTSLVVTCQKALNTEACTQEGIVVESLSDGT